MDTTLSSQHILVTGGTGFIGAHLCLRLRSLGYQLTLLTRNVSKAARLLGDDITYVDRVSLIPERSYFAIINLAGEPLAQRWNEKSKKAFRDSRIGVTNALLALFEQRDCKPEVLISGSAVGFYGDCGERLISEADSPGNGFAADLCRDWEAAAQRFSVLGTRVCLLRTGVVLDGDGGMLARMLPAFRMGVGGVLGSGEQWMPWIYREDLLHLITHCLQDASWSGPVNGVAPQSVTNREFTRTLGQVLHRPTWIPMPRLLMRTLFGEMADALMLCSQRIVPAVAIDRGFVFRYPELKSALKTSIKK